jgi:hypothetical protein
VNLNSQLVVVAFNEMVIQDKYQEACLRNEQLITESNERLTEIELLLQRNATLFQNLNQRLEAVTAERDAATAQKDEISSILAETLDDTAKECQAAQGILAEKDALVAQFQIALDTAQQRALTAESSLKEKDDVITALKSMFDGRDVMMKPHEPKGSHPRSGMMNLRGCAWYWWTTLPSALIPLVTELSI